MSCATFILVGFLQLSVFQSTAVEPAPGPLKGPDPLKAKVEEALKGFPGKVWIYARNLETGKSFGLREEERVRTASTIKLPILVAAHAEVKSGKVKWSDVLEVSPKTRAQGAGVLLEMEDGHKISLKEAARLMIVVSDNIATNLVIDHLTCDTINERLAGFGLEKTRSLGKIGGGGRAKAFSESWNKRADGSTYGIGVSTPREMVELLTKLDKGEIVSKEESKEILKVLSRQQYHDGVGRNLKGVSLATKPGALDRLRSDVGILSTPKSKVALAITIDDMPSSDWSVDNPAHLMLSRLSNILWEGLSAKADSPSQK